MRPAARHALVGWLVLGPALCTAGCGTESPAPAEPEVGTPASAALGTPVLSFDFDDLGALEEATGLGAGRLPLRNDTAQPVTVRISAVSGGTLRAVPGRDGGYAARFPALNPSDPRRAVMTVTTTSEDPFNPGVADFSFGADFTVDEAADQPADDEKTDSEDNGNNLLQRGLFSDAAQYKLQVDGGRVSCRIAGTEGEVVVKAPQPIEPDTWYRVSCMRVGERITLQVDDFEGDPERTSEEGPTGSVHLAPTTPVVLGGKARLGGAAVAADSDQFNGALDNVFLTVDEDS
jgi:hypothetical protein